MAIESTGYDFLTNKSGAQEPIASHREYHPHKKIRLSEQIFGNLDEGTEFDDIFFQNLDQTIPLDLAPEQLRSAQRLSMLLFRKNVRAYAGIELIKDFVLGDGVRFAARDPQVQALLDKHWKINRWSEKLSERIRALSIFGEQLYPIFIREKDGFMRLSSISPFRIIRLKRDPENAEEFVKAEVSLTEFATGVSEIETKDYSLVRTVQDLEAEDVENPAMYFPVNRVAGASRGIPDMTSAIDWLEGLDGLVFAMLERAELTQDVVYDITYEGGDEEKIERAVKDFARSMKAGGIYAHNERVTLKVQVPDLGASESETMASIMMRQIQAGMRLAGLFFGDSSDLTRASASELSVPVAKAIQGRQNFIKAMIESVFELQIEISKKAGSLKGVTDFKFEVTMSKVWLRDMKVITGSLVELSSTLESAVVNKWISNEQAGKFYRSSLEQLGMTADFEENENGKEKRKEDSNKTEVEDTLGKEESGQGLRPGTPGSNSEGNEKKGSGVQGNRLQRTES